MKDTTWNLLQKALEQRTEIEWSKDLGLHRTTIHKARARQKLSPTVAGAIAEKLGEDVDHWIIIAALESEKDSPCKVQMLKRLKRKSTLTLTAEAMERAVKIEPTS